MDLIGALSGKLGLSPRQAQALAGTVLGGVKGQLAEEDPAAAGELDSAVPELSDWRSTAQQFLNAPAAPEEKESGFGGMLGGLASAAAGGGVIGDAFESVAGKDAKQATQVVALLDRFGLGKDQATMVAPLALAFLKERLPPSTLDTALSVAPMFLGAGSDDDGGLGGMLGGLLG